MFDRDRNEQNFSETVLSSLQTDSDTSSVTAVENTVWTAPEFDDVTACAEIGAYAFLA